MNIKSLSGKMKILFLDGTLKFSLAACKFNVHNSGNINIYQHLTYNNVCADECK